MKELFDIKKVAKELCNRLYDNIDYDLDLDCYNGTLFAETEVNGYTIEVYCTADIDYHIDHDYDKYDCVCSSYDVIDDVRYYVDELTIVDADGEEIVDDEIISELIKMIEK